jgi:hypothetical protein
MQNPKIIGWAGLLLFMLGMASGGLVYTFDEVTPEALRLAMGAGVLFALGCSTLAVAGVRRLELRVQELERK